MMKLFIPILIFLLNLSVAFAQTGLFTGEGGVAFATTGIVIVVIFFAVREFIKQFKRNK